MGSGQLHTSAALPPETSWYPLDRRLQSRSGLGDERKISQPLPALEPPTIQPIAQRYTTEIFRLFECYRTHKSYIIVKTFITFLSR
jgi:hypothetical protein